MLPKDQEVALHDPLDAHHHGIQIVGLDLALCDNLTAMANAFLDRELTRRLGLLYIND